MIAGFIAIIVLIEESLNGVVAFTVIGLNFGSFTAIG